jgi:geranylgeranyl diphosphate synthase type II
VAQGEKPGGAEEWLLNAVDGYGRCLGQAFQIVDDLLDVEGTAASTGKRVGKDSRRGKLTYPGILGISESRRLAETLCQQAVGYLQPLGRAGTQLAAMAPFILERNR